MSDPSERFRATLSSLLYFSPDGGLAEEGSAPGETGRESAGAQKAAPVARECRPGDRKDFQRRLATFKTGTWFAKPPSMAPVPCARRGWANVASDTIECESCGARVILKIPEKATREEAAKIAAKVFATLDSKHKRECAWKGTTCPMSLARFPRVSDAELRQEFENRRNRLSSASHLPKTTTVAAMLEGAGGGGVSHVSGVSKMNKVGVHVGAPPGAAKRIEELVEGAGEAAETATLLALCGWDTATDGNLGKSPVSGRTRSGSVIVCRMCETRCATWNFAPGPTSTAAPGGTSAPLFEPDHQGASPSLGTSNRAKPRAIATGAQLMGAMGGSYGTGTGFSSLGGGASPSGVRAGSPSAVSNPPLMGLGFSIAGGASPSNAPSPSPFGATGSPSPAPAFGAGAQRSSPFGVPASSASNEKETTIAAPGESPTQRMTRSRAASKVEKTPPPKFSLTGDGGGAVSVSGNTPSSTGKRKRSDGEHVDPSRKELKATSSAGSKRAFVDALNEFHPLTQHRAHCPWIAVHRDESEVLLDADAVAIDARRGWVATLDTVAPLNARHLLSTGDDDEALAVPDFGGAPGAGGGVEDAPGGAGETKTEEISYLDARTKVACALMGRETI